MIVIGTLSFLLLLIAVYLIARPFLIPQLVGVDDEAQLREERARLLGQLHDLEMEFSTGKLAEVEYTAQREGRERQVAAVEDALSDLELAPSVFDDDELERLIASRRDTLAGSSCPSCDAPHDPDDRFCRACGADLTEVISR